ncbi:two-component sensor histidine kinase [Devosia subaequoris]|uniref:histidine kinase n=1 Tax=Devosia subaequoris TaxID=395930 RepID=A0A7W6IJX7_9HYPH|nr:cache domain-containing protein [Devosia subaequoris]MBB4050930.1 two-component sensor histidine kinase [Devosia subaequoris]MCP1208401.1 cache domain-containing protein [Devosia subaequoris]
MFFVVGALIFQWHKDTESRAAASAIAAAQAVKINTGWIVEVAEQALHRMDLALEANPTPGSGETQSQIEEALEGLPVSAKAYIVSAAGRTLYTTDPGFADIDIRDRDYFSVPASGEPFYTSSLLISRLDGSQIFAFSQRLERGGDFAGVAVISFDVDLLGELLDSLALDPGSTVSIVREDGMLVGRFPKAEGPMDLREHVLFTDHLPRAETGTYAAISPVDQKARIIGYAAVPDTSLIAVASVSMSETLDRFWRGVGAVLLLIIPVGLGLTLAAVGIVRLLFKDNQRREELERALETNTLMFREIHHRVKNNLQSMQSLIRMQDLPRDVKRDIHLRFAAMSSVHEHMYHHDAYAALEASAFVASIVEPLVEAYGSPAILELDIAPIAIDHDRATPLALLLNEVVTNALKHAFVGGEQGKLIVSLQPVTDGKALLKVADNGVGYRPEEIVQRMGSKLINAMVMQLDGQWSQDVQNGVVFKAEVTLN